MQKILIEKRPWITKISLLDDGRLTEFFIEEMTAKEFSAGNIYKGIVVDVVQPLKAVFVDIGAKRTAYLFVHKVSETEKYKRGDEIIVQIKTGFQGDKGAKLTDQPTLPGKFTVLTTEDRLGISKKLLDKRERRRLFKILKQIKPNGLGVVARTEARGVSEEMIKEDFAKILSIYEKIKEKSKSSPPPVLLWTDSDPLVKILRDIASNKLEKIIVDDEDMLTRVKSCLAEFMPHVDVQVELYKGISLFDDFGVSSQIEGIFSSKVELPSGIEIIFNELEAFTSIDVNTGSYTGEKGGEFEDTVLSANLEAAKEIARQIRLRKIGGIVLIDFIDMKNEESKRKLVYEFRKELTKSKDRVRVLGLTNLGLLELTRKRTGDSLMLMLSERCPHCGGTGFVLKKEYLLFNLLEDLRKEIIKNPDDLRIRLNPSDYEMLVKTEHYKLLLNLSKKVITIQSDRAVPEGKYFVEKI